MKMPIENFVRCSAWCCLVLVCFSLIVYVVQGYLFGQIYVSQSALKFVTAGFLIVLLFVDRSNRFWGADLSMATKGYIMFCAFFSLRLAFAYEFNSKVTVHAIAYSLTLTPFLLILLENEVYVRSKKILIGIGLLSLTNFLMVYSEFLSGHSFFPEDTLNWLYNGDWIKLDNLMGIERYNGLFKRPLEMGIFFGLTFIYIFWRATKANTRKQQLVLSGAAGAAAFLVLASGVRGVLISTFVATCYLCVRMSRRDLLRSVSVLSLCLLFCLISIGISPYGLSRFIGTLLNPTNVLNRLVIWARVLGFDISFISFGKFHSTETIESLARFSLNSLTTPADVLFGKGLIQNTHVSRNLAVSFDSTYLAVMGACGLVGLVLFVWAIAFMFRAMRKRHAVYGAFMVFMMIGFLGENMLNIFYFPILLVMVFEGLERNSFWERFGSEKGLIDGKAGLGSISASQQSLG